MNYSRKTIAKTAGVTLIELLLYVGITSVILLAASSLLTLVIQGRVKGQTIQEVDTQTVHALQIMTQTIRNAVSITSPTNQTSSTTLMLTMPDTSKSPTIFDLSNGRIRMKEGAEAYVFLTSDKISLTALQFQNASRPSTPGTIRISATAGYVNPSGRNEFSYTKQIYATASLR